MVPMDRPRNPKLVIAWQHAQQGNPVQAEKIARQLLRKQPRNVEILRFLGSLLGRMRQTDEATRLLERATSLQPRDPLTWCTLADVQFMSEQFKAASINYLKAIELDASCYDAWLNLGRLYLRMFDPEQAIEALRRATQCRPDAHAAWRNLADACQDHGRQSDAYECYQTAERTGSPSPQMLANFAHCALAVGEVEHATDLYDRAMQAAPDLAPAIAGKANLLETLGRYDDAIVLIEDAAQRGVESSNLASVWARIARRTGNIDEPQAYIQRMLANRAIPVRDRATIYFALGSLLEKQKDFDAAFDAYRSANDLYPRNFEASKYRHVVDGFIRTFSADAMKSLPRSTSASEVPVFIVGMPRSGTSLVEQVLSCHPDVYAAGELNDMIELVIGLPGRLQSSDPYPLCMPDVTSDVLDSCAGTYLDAQQTRAGRDVARATDKLPHNFTHLGFINLLFPNARIIHCMRNPLDTCLSCYVTQLGPVHLYANRLQDLGQAYGEYRRLMAHWEQVIDLPIFPLQYEEMVEDQERVSRELLEFLGLPWDDACLQFHETGRITRTASVDQVRQPIYKSSVSRSDRFGSKLDPLRKALAEFL